MKTKEELSALRNEVKALNTKLAELSEEELSEVAGGQKIMPPLIIASDPLHDTHEFSDWTKLP